MKTERSTVYGIIAIIFVYLVSLFLLFNFVIPSISSTVAGLVGVAIGAIGTLITSAMTILKDIRKVDLETKDRISRQALELSHMYFDLQQKSLETTQKSNVLLSPVKVYREIYKALYEYERTGIWPKNLEEQGLLNIFELNYINKNI